MHCRSKSGLSKKKFSPKVTYDNRVSCYCWFGYPHGAFPIPFCPLLNAGTDIVQPSSKARGPPCCLHLFSGVPPTRQTLQDRIE
jgi:hypothetical protein